ncbi:MAG TPA: hypothetical protein VF062_22740 [Candidatus Limnocylindrales bacterium]
MVTPLASANLVANGSGTGTFTFGTHLRLTEAPSPTAGMNVFQRGFAVAGSSQWKLQADFGVPSCRWSDGVNSLLLPGSGGQTDQFHGDLDEIFFHRD